MVASLFAKMAFYPTVGYTMFMAQFTSRKYFHRIDDTVVLGALPLSWVLKKLIEQEKIKALVSVNEGFELEALVQTPEELNKQGIKQLCLETVDFVGTPSQENIRKAVDFIQDYRRRKESVYVHCKAGRTRSATVVACYLMEAYGYNPKEAVEFIQTKRHHIWIREKQWNSMQTFYDSLSDKS